MFLSMTGYGSASREFEWGTVTFELNSVNHRYQDFVAKLPRELAVLESRLVVAMRSLITRGKVRLTADIAWNPGARTPSIDEEGLVSLVRNLQAIAVKNNLEVQLDLTKFLNLPGICEAKNLVEADDAGDVQVQDVWTELLIQAAKSLKDMKKLEGDKLYAVILKDLIEFERINKFLADRWAVSRDDALESLRTRIETVTEHFALELDEARVAQEVSLMADRWDVSEEIARLNSHIERFHQTMDGDEPAGRRLDFLIQEMNREINTMGSKVADAEFRWGIVEAKSCLERIREQVQNVE